MVRTLNQIEQEMVALEQMVAAIAEEFHEAYGQYLEALGEAARQQLILACYHLCTHGYPDAFLNLTFNQRQELQQTLRQLGQKAKSEMKNQLQPIVPRNLADVANEANEKTSENDREDEDQETDENEEVEEIDLAEALRDSAEDLGLSSSNLSDMDLPTALRFIRAAMEPQNAESEEESNSRSDDESDAESGRDPEAADRQPENPFDHQDDRSDDRPVEPPIEDRPLTPKDLLYWQEQLEKSVLEALYQISHSANRVLHHAAVLPQQLPEPLLEVATKAELNAEAVASPPNLLSLMIETRSPGSRKPTMTTVIAVRLRLSEIEFASGSLSVWRSKIRELSARLSKLGRDYYQKQRERSVAQAEAAWRSSWYEE